MKVFIAPLITAAVLVNAATDYPIKYADNAAAATALPMDANQKSSDLFDDTYQKDSPPNPVFMPSLTLHVEPEPTTTADTKVDIKPTDDDDVDFKTTSAEPFGAKPTPEVKDDKKPASTPDEDLDEDSDDTEDDNLDKPAGIDFPEAEPTEKEPATFTTKTMTNYTISTVYATVTSTVTDCTSTVTYCPEKGTVVTKTISMYTTICPETTATPVATPISKPELPESELPESDLPESEIPDSDSDEDEDENEDLDLETLEPEAPEPTPVSYLTKTVETTVWYTVTDCPPKATNCPKGLETSSISTYTEVYPVTDLPYPTAPQDSNSTETQYGPYVTGSPSSYPISPETNVTTPTTPPNFSDNAGSLQKADGLLMFIGLGVATAATALLQVWF